ncbi:nucleoside triphosphatase [Sulfolobus acidocaldarius SUSAZ]|nr:nucleoside triphosphatase [Sulfolobus acidocaldarius SUSAZ]
MDKPFRIYITGKPGIGKTTLLSNIYRILKEKNWRITGFYCPEVRGNNTRVGFKIKSILSGKEAWLARVDARSGIRIGKYYVVLEDNFVRQLEEEIFSFPDIILIDEIGPMELSSLSLKNLINKILTSNYPVIAVIHRSIKFDDGVIYEVTIQNRNILLEEILGRVTSNKNNI